MKNITGIYHVADCEHWCDMDSAKSFIRSLGCVITDSYWDGRDCGEAWVEFSFPECRYVAIYNKLGSSAGYSADIRLDILLILTITSKYLTLPVIPVFHTKNYMS